MISARDDARASPRLGLSPVPVAAAAADARAVAGLRRHLGREDPSALRRARVSLPGRGSGRRLVPPRRHLHLPPRRLFRHGVRGGREAVQGRRLRHTPLGQRRVRLAGRFLHRPPRPAARRTGHGIPGHGPARAVAALLRRLHEQPQGRAARRAADRGALLPDAPRAPLPLPAPPGRGAARALDRAGRQRSRGRARVPAVPGVSTRRAHARVARLRRAPARGHARALGRRRGRRAPARDGVLAVGPGPPADAPVLRDAPPVAVRVAVSRALRRPGRAGGRPAVGLYSALAADRDTARRSRGRGAVAGAPVAVADRGVR